MLYIYIFPHYIHVSHMMFPVYPILYQTQIPPQITSHPIVQKKWVFPWTSPKKNTHLIRKKPKQPCMDSLIL